MSDTEGRRDEYERLVSDLNWGPQSTPATPAEDTYEDDVELTEAEATVAPSVEELVPAEIAQPAAEASPVHPHVQVAAPSPPPPAGWYPDPHNPVNYRWWDGSAWTDAVHSVLRNDTRYQQTAAQQEQQRIGQDVRGALRGLADDLK